MITVKKIREMLQREEVQNGSATFPKEHVELLLQTIDKYAGVMRYALKGLTVEELIKNGKKGIDLQCVVDVVRDAIAEAERESI